jgi:o-succinylbenzoate synthase
MVLRSSVHKKNFSFGFQARTSRGQMRERNSWFIKVWGEENPEVFGVGECGPLPGLSVEDLSKLDEELSLTVGRINHGKFVLSDLPEDLSGKLRQIHHLLNEYFSSTFLSQHPALVFALETAILDLSHGGTRKIFENPFSMGQPVEINGLVWMGGLDFMLQQVEIKIRDGFRCLKLKIGGMDFDRECDILQYIRRKYFRDKIEIRLDANGAFKPEEASYKLKALSRFDVHSIEQPIKPGKREMEELCKDPLIPIALDEELIGLSNTEDKERLLDRIKPQYVILKPSLLGGLLACEEWITMAKSRGIGWWITSALESSVGLNALGQYASSLSPEIPQGLGTGEIFTNNIGSPLQLNKGQLSLNLGQEWDFSWLV